MRRTIESELVKSPAVVTIFAECTRCTASAATDTSTRALAWSAAISTDLIVTPGGKASGFSCSGPL